MSIWTEGTGLPPFPHKGVQYPALTTVLTLTRPADVSATFYPANSFTAVVQKFKVGSGSMITHHSPKHHTEHGWFPKYPPPQATFSFKVPDRGTWSTGNFPQSITSLTLLPSTDGPDTNYFYRNIWDGKATQVNTGAPTLSFLGYEDITGVLQDPPRPPEGFTQRFWESESGTAISLKTTVTLDQPAIFRLKEPDMPIPFYKGSALILGPGTTFEVPGLTGPTMRSRRQRVRRANQGIRRQPPGRASSPEPSISTPRIFARLKIPKGHDIEEVFTSLEFRYTTEHPDQWTARDVISERVMITPLIE